MERLMIMLQISNAAKEVNKRKEAAREALEQCEGDEHAADMSDYLIHHMDLTLDELQRLAAKDLRRVPFNLELLSIITKETEKARIAYDKATQLTILKDEKNASEELLAAFVAGIRINVFSGMMV